MKIQSVHTVKVLAIQFAMSATIKQPYDQGLCFIHRYIYVIIIIMYVYYEYKCTTLMYISLKFDLYLVIFALLLFKKK